ncbi:MAG: TerC family protein [Firmicutes bacterium]|nr:TerC family protein [Bacillota bacterium]MCL5039009.1 TerC family protein [Bacillota bacterium]
MLTGLDHLSVDLLAQFWSLLTSVLGITIIDLALSGDNAAIIGLAIKDLPDRQRKKAAFLGAGGAIILRVFFTAIATTLLRIPYINALGGLILIWITWKLVMAEEGEGEFRTAGRFWEAVWAIILADLSMAFDNVMGVAGAAHGSVGLVLFGLALSIPIVVLGSNWLATLMNRYPIFIYLGAAVLAHTALAMLFHDGGLHLYRYTGEILANLIPWLLASLVLIWGWSEVKKLKRAVPEVASADETRNGDASEK